MICDNCKTDLGDGWCRACDTEHDRRNPPADDGSQSLDIICAEVVLSAAMVGQTDEKRTPPPAIATEAATSVQAALSYLYAEAGIRSNMLGTTAEERLAHIAVRQDSRELAEHYGLNTDHLDNAAQVEATRLRRELQ